jgi:hypothetical protein
MPRGSRIVDAQGIVHDVARFVIAMDGEAKEVGKGWVAEYGVVRQFWPPTTELGDALVMTTDAELSFATENLGEGAPKAICNFDARTGLIWLSELGGQRFVQAIGPAPREKGKFLWKFDIVSGNVVADSGDPIGVWVDMLSEGTLGIKEYSLTNAQGAISVEVGQATVSVAEDDGLGAPVVGTEISKAINFQAEITGPNLVLTSVPWTLDHVTVNEPAITRITVTPLPGALVFGYEGSSLEESEVYAIDWNPEIMVQAKVLSGAVTGDEIDVFISTDQIRQWVVEAPNLGDDNSAEVSLKITDGVSEVSKYIMMHAQQNDESSSSSLSDEFTQFDRIADSYHDFEGTGDPVPDISVDVIFNSDGTVTASSASLGGPLYNFPQDWNNAAPALSDPENYEIQMVVNSGPVPNGPAADIWWNLSSNRNWGVILTADDLTAGTHGVIQQTSDITISIREVGRPSTVKSKNMELYLEYQVEEEPPPGGVIP